MFLEHMHQSTKDSIIRNRQTILLLQLNSFLVATSWSSIIANPTLWSCVEMPRSMTAGDPPLKGLKVLEFEGIAPGIFLRAFFV